MRRTLIGLAVLLTSLPFARADAPQPGIPAALTLSPAPLPSPSLKYRLLPEDRDLVAGDAATLYYRSLALLVENRALLQDLQEDHWDQWFIAPLKDLPLKEVEAKLPLARHLLHEVELATHYRECNWDVEGRSEGTGLLPPDIRGFRRLGVVLGVRARFHMAQGHLPEALQDLQTGLALARHLGSGPTLNHVLVGEVVANLINAQLEDFVQQPGAPNLYWALAVLPRPFFDPQRAVQDEAAALERTWPWLKRLEGAAMSQAQVREAQQAIQKSLDEFGIRRPGTEKAQEEAAPEARRGLLAQGLSEDQLKAMPTFQVVALSSLRAYRSTWEEYVKWFALPGGRREPGCRAAAEKYEEARARLDRLFFRGLVHDLEIAPPSALEKVYGALDQHERRFAALRCIEALRLYAADHKGQLPAALKDVTAVPVPPDPVAGKPFAYEASAGDKARLAAPTPSGTPPTPVPLPVYELTLRKKERNHESHESHE